MSRQLDWVAREGHTMCGSTSPSSQMCDSWHTTKGEMQCFCSLLWQLSSYTRCSRLLTDSSYPLLITTHIRHHYSTVQPTYTQKLAPILRADKFLCLSVRDSCLWRDLLEFRPHGVFVREDADNDGFMCSVNQMYDVKCKVTFRRKSTMLKINITCRIWNVTLSPNDSSHPLSGCKIFSAMKICCTVL